MTNEEFEQFREESMRTWERIDHKVEFLVEQQVKTEIAVQKTEAAVKNLTQIMIEFAANAEADRQVMRNMLAKMGTYDEKILDHEKRLRKLEE